MEVIDEQYMDTPSGKVDTGTGELLDQPEPETAEGEYQEVPDSPESESTAEVVTESPEPDTGKGARDPSTLKTNSEMVKACFADFGMQPADVLAELNVTRMTELTETPAQSYERIASVRQ
jgi:hypothetical protein